MPEYAFFSHVTAALLLGVPLPPHVEREPALHISVPAPARAPHAHGILGHRLSIDPRDLITTHGITHTNANRTWLDLASMLRLHDLVAAGDYLIHHRMPLTTIEKLTASAVAHRSNRGARKLAQALPLLSDRAESHPESVLRVILSLGGLPAPRINHEIVETESGGVMRTDLAFVSERVLLEYQGDYHRSAKGQWRKDMTRRSRLEAQGWVVMELNADDLRDPRELCARVGMVLRRQRGRG